MSYAHRPALPVYPLGESLWEAMSPDQRLRLGLVAGSGALAGVSLARRRGASWGKSVAAGAAGAVVAPGTLWVLLMTVNGLRYGH